MKDKIVKAKIDTKIKKLVIYGSYDDCKYVRDKISEIKINYADGYRIYFTKKQTLFYYF
ncbi:MAG: hypothetical protein LBD41_02680 [Clostridiales Family XIII bacterium]|nr:hypothetical protein [Clostridiales Family XIII bacterium]